jgi:hypothetical protein
MIDAKDVMQRWLDEPGTAPSWDGFDPADERDLLYQYDAFDVVRSVYSANDAKWVRRALAEAETVSEFLALMKAYDAIEFPELNGIGAGCEK